MIYSIQQRRGFVISLDSLDAGTRFSGLTSKLDGVGPLDGPSGIVINQNKWLVIADSGNNRVVVIDTDTGASVALDPGPPAIGALRRPTGVAVTATGQLVVADTGNHRVVFAGLLVAPQWSAFGSPGGVSPGSFNAPTGVYVDSAGRILVADPGSDRLVRFDAPDGSGWTEFALPPGARPARPYSLSAGPGDSVLVTDIGNARILQISVDDSVTVLIDGLVNHSLIAPVAVSMFGADIVVAEAGAARISRWIFDADSAVWSVAQQLDGRSRPRGGPAFSSLTGLAIKEQ